MISGSLMSERMEASRHAVAHPQLLLSFFCSSSTSCRPSVTSYMMRPRRQHEGSTQLRVAARAHDFSSRVKLMNFGLLAGLHSRLDERVDAKKLACTTSLGQTVPRNFPQENMSAAAERKVPPVNRTISQNVHASICVCLCMYMSVRPNDVSTNFYTYGICRQGMTL